jgi:hypothetical protein
MPKKRDPKSYGLFDGLPAAESAAYSAHGRRTKTGPARAAARPSPPHPSAARVGEVASDECRVLTFLAGRGAHGANEAEVAAVLALSAERAESAISRLLCKGFAAAQNRLRKSADWESQTVYVATERGAGVAAGLPD